MPLRGGGSWRWDEVVAEVVFDGGVVNTLHVMSIDLTNHDLEEVLEEVDEGLVIEYRCFTKFRIIFGVESIITDEANAIRDHRLGSLFCLMVIVYKSLMIDQWVEGKNEGSGF